MMKFVLCVINSLVVASLVVSEFHLNLPSEVQCEDFNSGAAVASCILRSTADTDTSYQPMFEVILKTRPAGTRTREWIRAMYEVIRFEGHFGGMRFSFAPLEASFNDSTWFEEKITKSLKSGMPVVVGLCKNNNSSWSPDFVLDSFIMITGFTDYGNANIKYTYMDPADGKIKNFTSDQLPEFFSNGGGIAFYDDSFFTNKIFEPAPRFDVTTTTCIESPVLLVVPLALKHFSRSFHCMHIDEKHPFVEGEQRDNGEDVDQNCQSACQVFP